MRTACLVTIVLTWMAGCGGGPSQPTAVPSGAPGGTPSASNPPVSGSEGPEGVQLGLGHGKSVTLGPAEPKCSYTTRAGALVEGPCRKFFVLGSARGLMDVDATWASSDSLAVAVLERTGEGVAGAAVGSVCCQSPLHLVAGMAPFDVTPFAVVFTGPTALDHEILVTLSAKVRP